MVKWPSGWFLLAWVVAGFLTLFSGVVSGDVVTMVCGTVMAFGATSAFLISYVKSEHRVKRALEVGSVLVALGVVVYGYAITGSFILEVITLFIVTMVLFAFVVSYLLPKIRGNRMKT